MPKRGLFRALKSYDRVCIDCGQGVNRPYVRCYECNLSRQRANWHDEEVLPDLEQQDIELGRNEFYVYVLDTTYGHYVGHTSNINARLRDHLNDQTPSTADANPRMVWRSRRYYSRAEVARFEAQLKSLRDNKRPSYQEITGLRPVPFLTPSRRPDVRGVGDLVVLPYILAVLAIVIAIVIFISLRGGG